MATAELSYVLSATGLVSGWNSTRHQTSNLFWSPVAFSDVSTLKAEKKGRQRWPKEEAGEEVLTGSRR